MGTFVYIATTLDGYIARQDGNLDWLDAVETPDNSDYGYGDFIAKIDAIVMGRKSYEKVLTFGQWPYAKPVFVRSTTLNTVPEHLNGKIKFIQGEPKELITTLEKSNYHNLYIDGGITIQGFLAEDLIDELIITTVPLLIGGGHKLFGELKKDLRFQHIEVTAFKNGLVQNHYKRKRE